MQQWWAGSAGSKWWETWQWQRLQWQRITAAAAASAAAAVAAAAATAGPAAATAAAPAAATATAATPISTYADLKTLHNTYKDNTYKIIKIFCFTQTPPSVKG